MSSKRIEVGDYVTVMFANIFHDFHGRVLRGPERYDEDWVIEGDDSSVRHVRDYAMIVREADDVST